MKSIFFTILMSVLTGSLVLGMLSLVSEFSFASFIYLVVMVWGNILIPTIAGVLIFRVIKKRVRTAAVNRNLFLGCLMSLLLFIGLGLWAIFDVAIRGNPLNVVNVRNDFYAAFQGYLPAGIVMALMLPFTDNLFSDKKKSDS